MIMNEIFITRCFSKWRATSNNYLALFLFIHITIHP
jgi:hypothetical protein